MRCAKSLQFFFVETVDEVLEAALEQAPEKPTVGKTDERAVLASSPAEKKKRKAKEKKISEAPKEILEGDK